MRLKDPEVFRAKVRESGLSHRQLAGAVQLKHWSTIGHLTSGRMLTCSKTLADRLERVLRCDSGELFEPKASHRSTSPSTVRS